MIPVEILEKYNVPTIEELEKVENNAEKRHYELFLDMTDFEIIKAYEKLMTEPLKFLSNLIEAYKITSEVIQWRMYAREELQKINA